MMIFNNLYKIKWYSIPTEKNVHSIYDHITWPQLQHFFSRITKQHTSPMGKKMIASAIPQQVNSSWKIPTLHCGQFPVCWTIAGLFHTSILADMIQFQAKKNWLFKVQYSFFSPISSYANNRCTVLS